MYLTYTRHRIRDYDVWKKAFDENSPMLAENNVTWEIVQVNGDPTDIAIICRCAGAKEWEGFTAAVMAKQKQTGEDGRVRGGVIGEPEWWTGEVK